MCGGVGSGEKERQLGKLLEGVLRQEGRVELHKLYCQWRQTAWLLTFHWHRIESELLE